MEWTDDAFLDAFENCSLPESEFDHRGHLRLGWLYLERYSLEEASLADKIEAAVSRVLDQGLRTADIYSEGMTQVGTAEMGDAVIKALKA